MKKIAVYSGLTLALFGTLTVLETLQEDGPLTAATIAFDLLDTGLLVLAVIASAYFAIETREFRRQRADLVADLARATADGDRWRATARVHIEGLSRAISAQFAEWRLTDGEADIAVLILKGLSHKEIARLRNSGEATVRQQARSIYRKSGLSSRAELSAFFLEDLLAPQAERGGPEVTNVAILDSKGARSG